MQDLRTVVVRLPTIVYTRTFIRAPASVVHGATGAASATWAAGVLSTTRAAGVFGPEANKMRGVTRVLRGASSESFQSRTQCFARETAQQLIDTLIHRVLRLHTRYTYTW